MSRHIYRASYARFTVYRDSIHKTQQREPCRECGGAGRYIYIHADDACGKYIMPGRFCSASCCRSYHDLNKRWGEM